MAQAVALLLHTLDITAGTPEAGTAAYEPHGGPKHHAGHGHHSQNG